MKIYNSESKKNQKELKLLIILLLIILLGLSIWPTISNYINYKIPVQNQLYGFLRNRGYDVLHDSTPIEALANIPGVLMRDKNAPPKVYIDIEFKNYDLIAEIRSKALHTGMHVRSKKNDWVKAKLNFEDKKMNVKLRLKGDSMDHWFTDKWSFKIDIKGDDHFMGMRQFAFQHPVTRAFQSEAMIQDTMRHYGILSPRYKFVNLIVNGENKGIMAVEESFDTELLEYNKRKDGVIFKLDETNAVIEKINPSASDNLEWYDSFNTTHIDTFNSSKYENNIQLIKQLSIAQGLMRGFMEESIEPSKVFDIEKTSKFLAILEIFGAAHTVDWRNIRFYLNPYTLKIEPISYDSSITDPAPIGSVINTELGGAILNDELMLKNFLKELKYISKDILRTNWLDELAKKDKSILQIFGNEFLFLKQFPIDRFRDRILEILDDEKKSIYIDKSNKSNYLQLEKERYVDFDYDEYLKLFSEPFFVLNRYQKNHLIFEIYNPLPEALEIKSIYPIYSNDIKDQIYNIIDTKITVPAIKTSRKNSFYSLKLPFDHSSTKPKKWNFNASIVNTKNDYTVESHQYSLPLNYHPLRAQKPESIITKHKFIKFDISNRSFKISEGNWTINEPIIFPKNYELIIEPGSNLTLNENVFLLVNGPIFFQGTQEKPILFRAEAEDKYWQGLIVIDADKKSKIDHTTFKNTQSVQKEGWYLTGAITFYASDIKIKNSLFINNIAEDSLNIIESDFDIDNVIFRNASSDFFDSDYSNGKITNLLMDGSIGDGLDLSGSKVELVNSKYTNIRDKAISVGEASFIKISNAEISNVGTGIAIKDGSNSFASDVVIKNANYSGIAVYNKKPVYGSSNFTIENIDISNSEYEYIAQTNNYLNIDNSQIQTQDVDVELLYETIMKKNIN